MDFKVNERFVIISIAVILIALTIFAFLKIFGTVLLAATMSIVLWPVVEKAYKKYQSEKISALIGVSIAFAAFLLIFVLPIVLILLNYSDVINVVESSSDILLKTSKQLSVGFLDVSRLITLVQGGLIDASINFVTDIPWYLFLVAVFFMSLYLMLRYGWDIKEKYSLMNKSYPDLKKFLDNLYESSFNMLYIIYVVFFVLAVATFLLAIPFFWILGYKNFLLYAIISGIFNFIPILGSTIIILAVFLHQYLIQNIWGMLFTVLFGYFIVSTFPELYIRPKLIGEKSQINWMIMFIAITGGVLIIGMWGFVFGPLLLTLTKTSYDMLLEVHKNSKK